MSHSQLFPMGAEVTLAALEGDVHPLLHRLRAAEPVSWLPCTNAWLVTRYDDAIAVMRDAHTFTVDHPGFTTAQVVGPSMLSLDGAEHLRHRAPFERPFRREEVQQRFRQPVATAVEELLDGLGHKRELELRRDFAGPVAVYTMRVALGLEQTSASELLALYDQIVDAVTRLTTGQPMGEAGRAAFHALRSHLLAAARASAGSSLLAMASGATQDLLEAQIASNAAVLLFGGIETTEGMIANVLFHLLTNDPWMRRARADAALIPNLVEESLRMEPAAAVVDRYATRDVQLGPAVIKAGDLVRVSLTAANRDPAVFAEPDRFDPLRPNLRGHVAFAQGPHVCLGLHLARLEAQQALVRLLARLPALRLVGTDKAFAQAAPRGIVFRKPAALRVVW